MNLRSGLAILALIIPAEALASEAGPAICTEFEQVDPNAEPINVLTPSGDEPIEVAWDRWRRDEPKVAWRTETSDATIRFETAPGMHPDRRIREVVGRRSEGGWEVYARSLDGAKRRARWSAWSSKALSAQGTQRLNALLADPCLWQTPPFLRSLVKLRNGHHVERHHGPSTRYDLSSGEQRWGGWHIVWRVGIPGQVLELLLAETFRFPEVPIDQIDPVGWLEEPFDRE
jgi:hypothetical protein